ncbi:hypothetical protein RclHR1_07540007 [Rhizophagus clarus]|uniref:Uncharacterized protein n=1 Tax=Rhizophagus clarus TaxID=94130 RepID=A0A2Z6SLP1_9GLOM|nr:hypothetical protein RclHR1_07540007 [Rhizophagus clarus]
MHKRRISYSITGKIVSFNHFTGGIKCSLEVENFWNNHKKTQELRQEIHPVKVYNELKLFQIESEDLNYALEGRYGFDLRLRLRSVTLSAIFERIINITNECSMMQESSPK